MKISALIAHLTGEKIGLVVQPVGGDKFAIKTADGRHITKFFAGPKVEAKDVKHVVGAICKEMNKLGAAALGNEVEALSPQAMLTVINSRRKQRVS